MNRLNVVLYEPEIPQNTGNIARTCAATGASLYLIRPFGFALSERSVKRSGMDYWQMVDLHIFDSWADFQSDLSAANKGFFSTKGDIPYTELEISDDPLFIIFGPETRGIPETILKENEGDVYRIPMIEGARSLNLSNSVAVVVYDCLRRLNFKGLL